MYLYKLWSSFERHFQNFQNVCIHVFGVDFGHQLKENFRILGICKSKIHVFGADFGQ